MAASAAPSALRAASPCTGERGLPRSPAAATARRTGFLLFVTGQQDGGGVAVLRGGGLGQRQGLFHLLAAGVVPRGGQHCADVAVEKLAVQGRRLGVHPLLRAVAGAVGRGDGGHGKADAAAPDGGQHARQRIRRQQKEHAFRRLLHDLQQGVGRFLVHPLHMVEQDGAALRRKAGVEDLRPHGRDLTHKIFSAGTHAGDRDGLPHDTRFDLAAVALAGLCHGTAAFAPYKRLSGRSALGVKIIGRNAAGRETGSQPLLAHQKDAVGQAAAVQHEANAGFQLRVAFQSIQHHRRFFLFHCSRRTHARTLRHACGPKKTRKFTMQSR